MRQRVGPRASLLQSATETASVIVGKFADHDAFLFARLYDDEYEFWQNETQLSWYEVVGKSTEGIRATHDPVFDQTIVDIRENPGRLGWRDGMKEAIGHLMWFGPRFWRETGATPSAVTALGRATEQSGMTRIRFAEAPFSAPSPDQEAIRQALFGARP